MYYVAYPGTKYAALRFDSTCKIRGTSALLRAFRTGFGGKAGFFGGYRHVQGVPNLAIFRGPGGEKIITFLLSKIIF